ncbi:MAG: polymer-forming cytoskeletal protein [Acidobacteria bacterium]|nr:polymer-forming cytoskeletal protein [Acidimicrobiaceae bacterium]MXX65519.1 polymer-forming cytoskeletal protein [Chloroflexota bacterium]MYF13745.1 polymer-forming cytoskeletal protein [Acidobacteriota bacterium]MYI95497.1 polymer-forming cytoskeletal protein [Acidobacteriota bacterium]
MPTSGPDPRSACFSAGGSRIRALGGVEECPRGGRSGIRSLPTSGESCPFRAGSGFCSTQSNTRRKPPHSRVLLVTWKKAGMGKTAASVPRATPSDEPHGNVSVIALGTEIIGGLGSEEAVHVYGKVGGPVRTSSFIVVGKGGRVMADIEAREVVVAGTVLGDIVGAQRVELRETGRIKGDIRTRRMKIEQGARFEGHLRVGNAAADGAASSPALVKTRGNADGRR